MTGLSVNWEYYFPQVPDYYTIIKKPMDFQTIKNNILCFVYSTPEQFVEDVSLVFRNAAQYNKVGCLNKWYMMQISCSSWGFLAYNFIYTSPNVSNLTWRLIW